jgi:hypothetical protein
VLTYRAIRDSRVTRAAREQAIAAHK